MKLINKQMTPSDAALLGPAISEFDPNAQRPSNLTIMAEAIRSTNTLSGYNPNNWEYFERQNDLHDPDWSGADALEQRPDLYPYTSEIMSMRSPDEFDRFVSKVDTEVRRNELLAEGGGAALFGQVIGTMGSPEFLPFLIWNPIGRMGMAKTAMSVAGMAMGEAAAHEAHLTHLQVDRDIYTSGMNVAVAGLMGLGLGAAAGGFAKSRANFHADLMRMRKEVIENNGVHQIKSADEMTPEEIAASEAEMMQFTSRDTEVVEGSVGARETKKAVLEEERPRWMPWIKSGQLSPIRTLWNSENPEVLRLLNKLWGHDLQVGYNSSPIYKTDEAGEVILDAAGNPQQIGVEHIAKEVAVARLADRESMAHLVAGNKVMINSFMKSIGREGKNFNVSQISKRNRQAWDDFNYEVRWAMSSGDMPRTGIEHYDLVKETADALRSKVYNPIQRAAKEAGLLEDDAVKFAESYMNRRYNRQAISNDEVNFKRAMFDAYAEERALGVMLSRESSMAEKISRRVEKLAKKQEGEPSAVRIQSEIDELEAEMQSLRRQIENREVEAYKTDDMEELDRIKRDVDDSFRKIVNGETDHDYFHRGMNASALKERKNPMTDKLLLENGWLHTDMLDQMRGYINGTMRPTVMKREGFDLDLESDMVKITDTYQEMIDAANEAGDAARAKKLADERKMAKSAHQLILDRYYGRTSMPQGEHTAQVAKMGQIFRNLNVMRMMGGVLFTSAADIARVNLATAYAGFAGPTGKSLVSAMRTMKLNREAYQMAGIAHETASMVRLSRWMDIADPNQTSTVIGKGSEQLLNRSQKGAQILMKATMLAEWTDYMKLMAAASTQNQLLLQVRNYDRLSESAKSVLAEIGIGKRMVNAIKKEIDAGNIKFMDDDITADINFDNWSSQYRAEDMKNILFRQSERLLVTPRETDLPPWMDNEVGRAVMQFKSFSLSAHNQITIPMLQRIGYQGDLRAISGVSSMMMAGIMTEAIKLFSQGREDELEDYSAMDWALAAADRSGAVPAIMMGFNQIDLMSGNALTSAMGAMPTSRYSDRNIGGVFGPTAGTIGDIMRFTGGLANGLDERDARSFRRLVPFNNLAWTHRMVEGAEQWLTEDLEQVSRR